MAAKRKVLITGASGRIAAEVFRRLRDQYDLLGLDCKPPADGDPAVRMVSLRDLDALREATRGVDTVLHFAARPGDCDWATMLEPDNIRGMHNIVLAAIENGVRRFVFASTNQVTGFYGYACDAHGQRPVRPLGLYAVTKVFGETLLRWAVDAHGLSAVCVRIGWAAWDIPVRPEENQFARALYVSRPDVAEVFRCAIEADVRYEIVHGLSRSPDRQADLDHARRAIGYEPADDSAERFPPSRDVAGVDYAAGWPRGGK
jgi:NAD+ dependent glucose-6-phosphate dehydrogenase